MHSADPEAQSKEAQPLFPQLTPGPGRMAPAQVARHQKARLEGAMVESVDRHGFSGTTVSELVALAGVSKSTFYQHFDSKQDCFLATFDSIISQTAERIGESFRQPGDFHKRLRGALTTVMEMVLAEPAAARLAIVESLTLGAAGVAERERASEAFELMVRQSFEHSPSDYEVGAATVRAITAGLRGVVYRRLRAGEPEQLPALVPDLVDWALGYQGPESEIERRAAAAAAEPRPSTRAGDEVPWTESPDSRRSRAELTQRERIVRAAGRLVIAKGFEALSIPAISNASGTSNQTFYEHFSNKREAFLAAFEESAATGLAATASAFEELGDRPEAVGAAIRAMLEHITANEHFARITFFDLQTAGPLALDYADLVMDSFTAFLQPDRAPSELGAPLPEGVLQAIGSGVWAVIQHEIVAGRLGTLPDMAPQITRVVSSPFGRNAESTA